MTDVKNNEFDNIVLELDCAVADVKRKRYESANKHLESVIEVVKKLHEDEK